MTKAASNHPSAEEALTPAERERLRHAVGDIGERDAANYLRVSRQTLGRAIAGLPLHRGTVALIRQGLASWEGRQ